MGQHKTTALACEVVISVGVKSQVDEEAGQGIGILVRAWRLSWKPQTKNERNRTTSLPKKTNTETQN